MGILIETRMIADLEDEFIVYMIEMQIHKLWQFQKYYSAVKV